VIRNLTLFFKRVDLPRAREFYGAALDVEFTAERNLEETEYQRAHLADGCTLELWPADGCTLELWPADGCTPSRVLLEFAVPDIDAAEMRLIAAGWKPRRIGNVVLLVDPNGSNVVLTAISPRGPAQR
jgi:predicted enzyme related to lactoylglutathione lyase